MLDAGGGVMKLAFRCGAPVLALLFSIAIHAQTPAVAEVRKGPTVLIRGNGGVTATGSTAFGLSSAQASKHDQTMEMAQQLLKHCPEITLVVDDVEAHPDYDLLLNREGLGWFDEGISQIMLVRARDKVVLYANKKSTVAKASKDGCKHILADWKEREPGPSASPNVAPSAVQKEQWWHGTPAQDAKK
jgi:hypothetical protein